MSDEVRLAKLQAKDGWAAPRGVLWLSLAFGASVVMFVALTLFLATLIGRAVNGHMWLGALVTGVVELLAGALLIRRGIHALTEPSLRLEASRATLADTIAGRHAEAQRGHVPHPGPEDAERAPGATAARRRRV